MSRARRLLEQAQTAFRTGIRDFRGLYTWRSWLFGWFARLMTQALFFTSFGYWLGSRATVRYMAVGNTTVLVCMESLAVIPLLLGERYMGTFSLHVAAPASFVLTYFARNFYCPLIGVLSSTFGFFVVATAFGVRLGGPYVAWVPVLTALIGLSAYSFGFAVGAIVLSLPSFSMVALNLSYLSLMAFCGVNVPVSYWPAAVRGVADILPLTHGLLALRELLAGAPAAWIWRDCALEAAVGLGWLAVAVAVLQYYASASRRTGNIQLTA
ncbi:MAG TPA: ABC transporter permease [Streptosporangiaceae bacterium]|nr:ABC transporter permease [Streptosporangiaceae bacterium]